MTDNHRTALHCPRTNLRDQEERERSCESWRQREGEGVGAGRGGVCSKEESDGSPWYISRKLSCCGFVGVLGADSGKVRSIRQEKDGVGEGDRRGEGIEIWGGERGEGWSTGLMPLMAGGRGGAEGRTSCTSSTVGWRSWAGGAGWRGCSSWRPTTCLARLRLCRPRRLLNLGRY